MPGGALLTSCPFPGFCILSSWRSVCEPSSKHEDTTPHERPRPSPKTTQQYPLQGATATPVNTGPGAPGGSSQNTKRSERQPELWCHRTKVSCPERPQKNTQASVLAHFLKSLLEYLDCVCIIRQRLNHVQTDGVQDRRQVRSLQT